MEPRICIIVFLSLCNLGIDIGVPASGSLVNSFVILSLYCLLSF